MDPDPTPETKAGAGPVETLVRPSPALSHRSEHYPATWGDRVPKRVRMAKTVHPDFPFFMNGGDASVGLKDQEYDAWVNSHGAVAIVLSNGELLGVKPYEFEVIEFH